MTETGFFSGLYEILEFIVNMILLFLNIFAGS